MVQESANQGSIPANTGSGGGLPPNWFDLSSLPNPANSHVATLNRPTGPGPAYSSGAVRDGTPLQGAANDRFSTFPRSWLGFKSGAFPSTTATDAGASPAEAANDDTHVSGIVHAVDTGEVTSLTEKQLEELSGPDREHVEDVLNPPQKPPSATEEDPEDGQNENNDNKMKLILAELLGGTALALDAAEKHHPGRRNHHLMRKFREARLFSSVEEARRAEKKAALLEEAKLARGSGKIEEAAALEHEAASIAKLSKIAGVGSVLARVGKRTLIGFAVVRAVEAGLIYKLAPDGKKEQWAWEVGTRSPFTAEARKDWAEGKYFAAVGDEFKGLVEDLTGLAEFVGRVAEDPKAAWGQAHKDLAEIRDGLKALDELYKRDPQMANKIALGIATDAGIFGDEFAKDPDKFAQLAHAGFMGDKAEAETVGKDLALDAATPDRINLALEQAGTIAPVVNAVSIRSRADGHGSSLPTPVPDRPSMESGSGAHAPHEELV